MTTKYTNKFMDSAIQWSTYSYCKRKQVGAVLVKDNREIASGYNGTITGHTFISNTGSMVFKEPDNQCEDKEGNSKNSVVHAEANIIAYCAKHGISTDNCSLYITLSPCQTCAVLLVQSGITKVTYKTAYKDTTGIDILTKAGIDIQQYKE